MTAPAIQFWPVNRRVERAAWSAISQCVKVKKLPSLPLPIPIEEWIEGPLGIRFDIADLSHLGENVLGVSRPKEKEIAVSETLTKYNARFRFTAAHELGHVLLHSRVSEHFRDSADGDFMDRRFEREADRFAASFLMPIPAFSSEFAFAASTLWSDPQSLLVAVGRGDSLAQRAFRLYVLPHLVRRFGVSTAAAVRRFADVQLPTGEVALPFAAGVTFVPAEQTREATLRL